MVRPAFPQKWPLPGTLAIPRELLHSIESSKQSSTYFSNSQCTRTKYWAFAATFRALKDEGHEVDQVFNDVDANDERMLPRHKQIEFPGITSSRPLSVSSPEPSPERRGEKRRRQDSERSDQPRERERRHSNEESVVESVEGRQEESSKRDTPKDRIAQRAREKAAQIKEARMRESDGASSDADDEREFPKRKAAEKGKSRDLK
ncbi:MAG: hypothetical protein Q9162_003822 [Coniocarpon cinnabarinum]